MGWASHAAAILDPAPAEETAARWPTPGALARALNPNTVQTPALDIIDTHLVRVAERIDLPAHLRGRPGAPGIDRLIMSMPPQEGKSERTTHYGVLWYLLRNPDLRVVIVSYSQAIAERMSYLIRQDLEAFNGTDGTVELGLPLRKDNRAVRAWNLAAPHQGGVYSIGLGGSLTGRPVDLMVIDDPVKDYQAADSLIRSELAWQWWMAVARTRLAPGAPVILVLTRWHENDLAGRLLTKQAEDEHSANDHYDRWHVINIPAQADHRPELHETDILGRQPGEYMLSARGRTQAQWEATRAATTPRIWSALYQGHPTPDMGDILRRDWWRYYETPVWQTRPDGTYRTVGKGQLIQSWDMTFKDTKGADFVVGQIWLRRGTDAYLLDQVRARLSFSDTLHAVRALTAKWPQARTKLVEDKANGTAVIDSLRSEIGGIIPVTPHESKEARAAAVSPFVEAGNVLLPAKPIALFDTDLLVDEATVFPNGAHDDQVDALSQALNRLLVTPGHGKAFLALWRRDIERRTEHTAPTLPADSTPAPDPDAARPVELSGHARLRRTLQATRCEHRWRDRTCVFCGEQKPD